MEGKILVIGATGTVGRVLVADLVRRGARVRAATRDPMAARAVSPVAEAVDFVVFDFERSDRFEPVLDGVESVFLMARPGDDDADRVAAPLIRAMKRRGVRHVVNMSALGVEHESVPSLTRVERLLEDSGLAFTHLRPNWFMQILLAGPLLSNIRTKGEIRIPAGEGKISFIDVRDIARCARVALLEKGHEGKAYELTGDQALDHEEVASLLSDAVRRIVRYVPLAEDDARRALAASGLPPERIERLLGHYRWVRNGEASILSPHPRALLKAPCVTFGQFARDHAAMWN